MFRLARDAAFRPWYEHLNIAVGAALISVVLAALGPTGHALYVAYMIAPLQAALYLGRTEAWQALILNLTGFALVTAIRAGPGTGGWSWRLFAQESLVLAFACVALIPMLTRIVARLRAARRSLAPVERGDLTVRVHHAELAWAGYLRARGKRGTRAIR